MANNKKKETKKVVKETKTEEVKNIEESNLQTEIKKEEVPKKIKIGSKVIVNGRTFGSYTLEAPMKTLRNYESKIVGISEDSYELKEGFVSKDSVTLK